METRLGAIHNESLTTFVTWILFLLGEENGLTYFVCSVGMDNNNWT
jgi:hypothetical protein